MRAAMRTFLVVLPATFTACAPMSSAPPGTSREAQTCRPTIARMVPPQLVMDVIYGGTSPRPSATPSGEVWAATGNWIGNRVIWVSLPTDGVFQRRYSKLWMIPLEGGPIAITGRRLDGDHSGTFSGSASDGNIGST